MNMMTFWVAALDLDMTELNRRLVSTSLPNPYAVVGLSEDDAREKASRERDGGGGPSDLIAVGEVRVSATGGKPAETILRLAEGSRHDGAVLWMNVYDESIGGSDGPLARLGHTATSLHASLAGAEHEASVRALASYKCLGRAKITLLSDGE